MPTFYTDMTLNDVVMSDDNGTQVASVDTAKHYAIRTLVEMLETLSGATHDLVATVLDEKRRPILRITVGVRVENLGEAERAAAL